jgi:hypothetical protein
MDIKYAIKKAIACVKDLFSDENIGHIGLEEVRFNEDDGFWEVTIGFSRPWDSPKSLSSSITEILNPTPPQMRHYKVVKIDDKSGEVKAIEIREVAHA